MIFSSALLWRINRLLLIATLVCVTGILAHATSVSAAGVVTEDQPTPVLLTAGELAWLKANPVLRVAALSNWEPIDSWTSGGAYTGISGDYLALLAKRLNLRLEVARYPTFDTVLAAVREGRADLVPSVAVTAERETYLAFSPAYLDRSLAIFLNRDANAIDLSGDWKPLAKVVQYDDTAAALTALAKGEADVYVGSLQPGSVAAEKLLLSNITVSGYFESPIRYLHLGVQKQNVMLHGLLGKAMHSILAEEGATIDKRWSPAHTVLNYAAGTMPLSVEQREWLAKNNRIRVGYDPELKPISFEADGGHLAGLAHDTLKLVTKKLGISVVEERKGTWAEILAATSRGEIDVLIAAGKNQERLNYLNFAGPYLSY
jgi:ABC-type amino acid transport substrate-binding protein